MNYFLKHSYLKDQKRVFDKKRIIKTKIKGFSSVISFKGGDVMNLVYRNKNYTYSFQGICISVRKKKITSPETSLILRNVIARVGVELSISFFSNRCFIFKLQDYKKKQKLLTRAKLYLIRHKANQQSLVV
tara:strand:+ start:437 stop:829 length:393 start_codon:yes stop_codon:yes gene_type:complete